MAHGADVNECYKWSYNKVKDVYSLYSSIKSTCVYEESESDSEKLKTEKKIHFNITTSVLNSSVNINISIKNNSGRNIYI